MRSILAACAAAILLANPLFGQSPRGTTAPAGRSGDAEVEEQQPSAPAQQAQDSILLANGKVRIGALFYAHWGLYFQTGFGPQFVTQTNFPGPGNDDFNTFDVHRAYINLFYVPSEHVTLRLTPNIYREAIAGSADKADAVGAIATSADGNLSYRLKYGYLEFGRIPFFENSTYFKNTNIRFGQAMNPLVDWEEELWDYRFLSLVPWNYLSLSSTQVGASLNGPIGRNSKTYLDYQVGIFNDASFHAFEFSEQKQFMVRASLYPMGARTRFQGFGLTGFYDHGYTNNAPDTNAAVPVVRVAAMAHYTTSSNSALMGFEYDYGKNAFNTANMFSGDGPQDLFGIGTTIYATQTRLWQAVLAGPDTRQDGWNVFGRYTFPQSKFTIFGWDQFFRPNTNIPDDPLDFCHIVAGVAYRVSPRWRVGVSDQWALYRHDQFTYPAATLATFNPGLAAANPAGIPNAVPPSVHAGFVSVEFSF
jgi:hypothetical protein